MDAAAEAAPSPAESTTDDVLVLLFTALAEGFCSPDAVSLPSHKLAAARFTWFRTTLPLVCTRWHRLVLQTPALWSCCIISPAAEAHAARRSMRQQQQQQQQQQGEQPAGMSPIKGSYGSSRFYYDASERPASPAASTPSHGASPVMGSSPESDSCGYWSSQFAPLGGCHSPRHISHRLSHLSTGRHHQRMTLSSASVTAWLTLHSTAASSISTLSLDLSHHMSSHDFDTGSLDAVLQKLPQVTRVVLAGAVEGTDAYEPLARLRQLECLELSSASQACLDGGLLALCFLPQLHSLSVALDISPAFPMALNDMPSTLKSLRLCAMWLEELPQQVTDCVGLTRIVLERCQVEQNPLPLLLTLPRLASITVRTASRGNSDASLTLLTPMRRPQRQLPPHHTHRGFAAAAANGSSSSRTGVSAAAAGAAAAGSSSDDAAAAAGFGGSSASHFNTSITSLSLIDVGLRQLPVCVSQLVALQELQLALNHDMALNPTTCLPQELTCLTGLKSLGLGNCSLHALPPVVAALTGLTRLELQGNALSVAGFTSSGPEPCVVGFSRSLRVLDLTAQGSGRARLRGIPAWVGQCGALTELRLGCSCLGYSGDSSSGVGGSTALHAANGSSSGLAAAAGGAGGGSSSLSRGLHHSSSDASIRGVHVRAQGGGHRGSSSSSGFHVTRSLDLGTAAAAAAGGAAGVGSGPAAAAVGPAAVSWLRGASLGAASSSSGGPHRASQPNSPRGGPHNSSSSSSWALSSLQAEGLSLQQLPVLLPQLRLLVVEGGVWEQRAVRDALLLVRQLARSGSPLELVLPL